jgi:hypothetical protein
MSEKIINTGESRSARTHPKSFFFFFFLGFIAKYLHPLEEQFVDVWPVDFIIAQKRGRGSPLSRFAHFTFHLQSFTMKRYSKVINQT